MKWMECEAISFNDVQDKICATAITATMCSTAPGQGTETQTRAVTLGATAKLDASRGTYCTTQSHWPGHSVGNMQNGLICLVPFLCHAAGKKHTHWNAFPIGGRPWSLLKLLLEHFAAAVLFLNVVQPILLKNTLSHIAGFFNFVMSLSLLSSQCIMSLDSTACSTMLHFISKLEFEQTLDKSVAPSQPVL